METLVLVSLVMFCILGVFDGLYFHLYKYKLHKVPEARYEHFLHTLRAFVFVPLSIIFFVVNASGLLIYFGLALMALDLFLELLDILEEQKSRKIFGGISSEESAIHVFASSFKFAAMLLVLAGKDFESYKLDAPLLGPAPMTSLSLVGGFFAMGCLIGGIQSVILASGRGFFQRALKLRVSLNQLSDS